MSDLTKNVNLSAGQCRAARALLELSQQQLAEAAQVSLGAVRDFETGTRQPRRATLGAIRQALETAGIEFIAPNGGGEGVRRREAKNK